MKPKNKLRKFLAACGAVTIAASSAHAASVLFVDHEAVHSSWETLIETSGYGHTYTAFDYSTYSIKLANQASIDYVKSFDVLVISGSNAAFNQLLNVGTLWAAQGIPMVNMASFLAAGQFDALDQWRWTTADASIPAAHTDLDVLSSADPIWNGVTLTAGTPPTIDILSSNQIHIGLGTFRPGITTVAALSSNNSSVGIAYAAAGTFGADSAAQYFITGMSGGASAAVPFTPAGNQVFLNAITALALIPEPSAALLGGLGLLALLRRRR